MRKVLLVAAALLCWGASAHAQSFSIGNGVASAGPPPVYYLDADPASGQLHVYTAFPVSAGSIVHWDVFIVEYASEVDYCTVANIEGGAGSISNNGNGVAYQVYDFPYDATLSGRPGWDTSGARYYRVWGCWTDMMEQAHYFDSGPFYLAPCP